ncbi:unnamed protein product, partial [Laminaria digitata]
MKSADGAGASAGASAGALAFNSLADSSTNSDISDWDRGLGSPPPASGDGGGAGGGGGELGFNLEDGADALVAAAAAAAATAQKPLVCRVSSSLLTGGSKTLGSVDEDDMMFCLKPGVAGRAGGGSGSGLAWPGASNGKAG